MGRKTRFSREEWREIFRAAAKYCSKHKEEYGRFQDCMKKVLREAAELGHLPEYVTV